MTSKQKWEQIERAKRCGLTDPRGGTIYLCKPEDANDSTYNRGVFIA